MSLSTQQSESVQRSLTLQLAARILRQIDLGAVGAAGTKDLVQNFLRVQSKLRHQNDLAQARGGVNQLPPRLRPPSSGRKNRPSKPTGGAAKKQRVGAPERRQPLLAVANLLEPGWTLVDSTRWVFVNKQVPAYCNPLLHALSFRCCSAFQPRRAWVV